MEAVKHHLALAKTLDPRLLNLFKRFPPPLLDAAAPTATASSQAQSPTVQIAENTSSSDPNANSGTTITDASTDASSTDKIADYTRWKRNPFLAYKNPATGNWHPPHYSLRRQAQLFDLAIDHGVLPLMPPSPKNPLVKEAKRIERGLTVKGTGEGQKVKGKYWERTLRTRLEIRRKAVEAMPDMINLWRERGHGRGWKKYPKGKKEGLDAVFKADSRHTWVYERAPPNV